MSRSKRLTQADGSQMNRTVCTRIKPPTFVIALSAGCGASVRDIGATLVDLLVARAQRRSGMGESDGGIFALAAPQGPI